MDSGADSDDSFNALLKELSYVPLAVTLLVSLGRGEENPTVLLQAWRDKAAGIDLVTGSDKTTSSAISIQLSIKSSRMHSTSDALTLLSIIAMLAGGSNPDLLLRLTPSISNLIESTVMLRKAAPTYTGPGSATLQLLSPIRSYVLKCHPASDMLKQVVYDVYTQYVTNRSLAMGGSGNEPALAAEETNLKAILPQSIQTGSKAAITSAIGFSIYPFWALPRLEVNTSVVEACQRNGDLDLLALSLIALANEFRSLAHHREAQMACEEADTHYRKLGG
ncbi:hypothetical protein FRB97_004502 [Tulasnella sp. 331]|nr:hypothetical protein FRB97_004502 [Tulasnella sp. 331]KAG8880952.1 hypothetical protein FRB98_004668 [Tulasnella sp. 332]